MAHSMATASETTRQVRNIILLSSNSSQLDTNSGDQPRQSAPATSSTSPWAVRSAATAAASWPSTRPPMRPIAAPRARSTATEPASTRHRPSAAPGLTSKLCRSEYESIPLTTITDCNYQHKRNGINFQVWCQRNIIEYTDPFDWTGKIAAIMNMNKRGTATFQNCLVSKPIRHLLTHSN